jgi:hypothetical protein
MSEHLSTVQRQRAKFPPAQYDLSGNVLNPIGLENAWTITNATAWAWQGEGWGLLAKPAGSNWQGYSVDVLVNVRERQAVDCLGDSEGAARPQWNVLAWEERFVDLWRPPVAPVPPDPPPPPPGDLEARVADLEARVFRIESAMQQAGAVLSSV